MCEQLACPAARSTSALADLLHKEWKVTLGCCWFCAAVQLFSLIFLNGCSEYLEQFDLKKKCSTEGIKKKKHNRGLPNFRLVSIPFHTLLLLSVRALFIYLYVFSETDLAV